MSLTRRLRATSLYQCFFQAQLQGSRVSPKTFFAKSFLFNMFRPKPSHAELELCGEPFFTVTNKVLQLSIGLSRLQFRYQHSAFSFFTPKPSWYLGFQCNGPPSSLIITSFYPALSSPVSYNAKEPLYLSHPSSIPFPYTYQRITLPCCLQQ